MGVGERSDLGSADEYCSDGNALTQQGRGKDSPEPKAICQVLALPELVLPLRRHVVDVDRPSVDDGATHCCATIERCCTPDFLGKDRAIMRSDPENVAVDATNDRVIRSAHARSRLGHVIEHPLQVIR